jgi:hypothetical protein
MVSGTELEAGGKPGTPGIGGDSPPFMFHCPDHSVEQYFLFPQDNENVTAHERLVRHLETNDGRIALILLDGFELEVGYIGKKRLQVAQQSVEIHHAGRVSDRRNKMV